MKTSTMQFGKSNLPGRKIMLTIALASMLGAAAVTITPALAADHDGRHDNGWHNGDKNNGRYDHRDKHYNKDYRDRNESYEYRYRRDPYYYYAPVYAPQPYYYNPQPSPGINLFFPLDFRN